MIRTIRISPCGMATMLDLWARSPTFSRNYLVTWLLQGNAIQGCSRTEHKIKRTGSGLRLCPYSSAVQGCQLTSRRISEGNVSLGYGGLALPQPGRLRRSLWSPKIRRVQLLNPIVSISISRNGGCTTTGIQCQKTQDTLGAGSHSAR